MPPRTRQAASLESAAVPSKRTKKETTKTPKKVGKPRQPAKQRSRKTAKKQEKPKPVQDEKPKSIQESFLEKVDTFFVNHIQELTCDREHLRIFVPLCGNSADMIWLANQGHTVVGVEIMAKWIKSFFKKSELKYTVTSEEIGSKKKANVYRAEDKGIVIYQCSIFDFDLSVSGGKFDGIWDQSAMPVINDMGEKKMKQYVKLLQSLLAPDGRHVVEVCKHGANFVTTERLKELYGENNDVRYFGTRMWKYEEDDEDGCEDEDGEHGHAEHDHCKRGHASNEEHDHGGHGSHHGDHSYASHHHGDHSHGDHGSSRNALVYNHSPTIAFEAT
ncbi:hypothetical protein QZH41_003545 [Actinostola sp. cb2023]|nr:hypothetical protein QZH41_003545 [Actinostola sp. cb2023]